MNVRRFNVVILSCFFFLLDGSSVVRVGSRSLQDTADVLEVVMRFGGDVLLAAHYEEDVGEDMHRAFEGFDLFQTDDLSMVNLEVPVTTRGIRQTKPFTFRMKPAFLDVLTKGGIDVVNIANNHIHDFGREGLFDTIIGLDSAKIAHVGAGRNYEEAHRPFLITIKGRTIGILGYYNGGEAPAATAKSPGVADRELAAISRDIAALKGKADFIIVNFHWGVEKDQKPGKIQQAFARSVIDAGADAIIGHHPHVLQGIELYRNKPIAYSLGNLIFGGNGRHTYDTGVFEIRLSSAGAAYRFIPVRVMQWKATLLSGDEGDRLLAEMRKRSSLFSKSIFN
jgi:poly-gamma-glutamate synthesis protein (capsule biosynthesis protein)